MFASLPNCLGLASVADGSLWPASACIAVAALAFCAAGCSLRPTNVQREGGRVWIDDVPRGKGEGNGYIRGLETLLAHVGTPTSYERLMGLSGLGDLTLTCNSPQSRNMSLGIELGAGRSMADILGERHSVAEGVHTVGALTDPASPHRVDMPICRAVDAVVNQGADIDEVILGQLDERNLRPTGCWNQDLTQRFNLIAQFAHISDSHPKSLTSLNSCGDTSATYGDFNDILNLPNLYPVPGNSVTVKANLNVWFAHNTVGYYR